MPNSASARLVLQPYSEEVVIRAARECLQELGRNPSLAIVFASADYRPHLSDFLELIQLHAHASVVVGGSGRDLVGTGVEAEVATGFCIQLLHVPQTRVRTVCFNEDQSDDFTPDQWRELAGDAADSDAWIILANPLRVAAEVWLNTWSDAFPGVPALGGLLSGGEHGDDIFLFHNREEVEAGIAIGLKGGVRLHPVVAQGCKPIGEPHAITGAEDNVLLSIGSVPAYERLSESVESLSEAERRAAKHNLFAGLAMDEYLDDFKMGDFLIRNLLHTDPQSGRVELAAYPRVGQTLQFQLRDAATAHEEMEHLLGTLARQGVRPFASLVFICRGRGEGLFGTINHDVAALEKHFGTHPMVGAFCNGEIGPVRKQNFVHGYSASIALLS